MSDNGDWSDDSDQATPLQPRLAVLEHAVLIEVMDMRGDFDVASSIFGTQTPTKKKGKQSTSGVLRAPSASTSSPLACSTMTPLSYATASPMTPAPESSPAGSTFSTPCPAPRYAKDPTANKFHEFIRLMQDPAYNPLSLPRFAELAEKSLAFIWQVLQTPTLKDYPLPQSVCGPTSVETRLAQIIAMSGPLPPPPATAPALIPPPVEKAARPLAPSMRPQYLHRLRRSLGPQPRLHFRDPPPQSVLWLRLLQHLVVASPPQSPSPPQCLWGQSLTLPPPPLWCLRRGKDTTKVENGTPTTASHAVVCNSLPRPDIAS
jgi:hypothetical protein